MGEREVVTTAGGNPGNGVNTACRTEKTEERETDPALRSPGKIR